MQVPDLRLKKKKKVTAVKEQLGKDVNIIFIDFYNNNTNMSLPCIVSDKRTHTAFGCIHIIMYSERRECCLAIV